MDTHVRKRRVLLLVHEDLVPPAPERIEQMSDDDVAPFKTEYHVETELRSLGHDVRVLGLYDELRPLRAAIEEFRPHVAFNLLEEFREETAYDYYIVNYLELHHTPYTGCSAPGLFLARDKALSKKILAYHRIPALGTRSPTGGAGSSRRARRSWSTKKPVKGSCPERHS